MKYGLYAEPTGKSLVEVALTADCLEELKDKICYQVRSGGTTYVEIEGFEGVEFDKAWILDETMRVCWVSDDAPSLIV